MKKPKPRWVCNNCGSYEPKCSYWDGTKGSPIKCESCRGKVESASNDYPKVEIYNKI